MIGFICSILFGIMVNLFFRQIKVRGFHHIPKRGPVLFAVAPHSNQFVDPILLLQTCGRSVGFLAAKKSMDKFFIGMFARAFNSIPVERPQDLTKPGVGRVFVTKSNDLLLSGIDTHFTKLQPKTMIGLPKEAGTAVIKEIISDTQLVLEHPFKGEAALALLEAVDGEGKPTGTTFTVTPHVDQSNMFNAVVTRLAKDQAVGIFPEGGSHDRPDFLPLKPGVAIMALETLAKFPGTKLKIIPTGLHFFHGDKFRSRAVVEYGRPIEIPIELVDQYKHGGAEKRKAIGLLLDTIRIRLNALTLQAPDFDSLMVAQASRRLYQSEKLDADTALEISRKFAAAFETLKDDPRIIELTEEVKKYNRMLTFYGVNDHQVKNTRVHFYKAFYLIFVRLLQVIILGGLSAPIAIAFSPLFLITKRVSKGKAKEALKGSKVKISGKDVVTTWKLLTALLVAPLLWLIYTGLAFAVYYVKYDYYSGFKAAVITFVMIPLLAVASIGLSDIAVDLLKSVRPLIVSLGNAMSSSEPLREMRSELQKKIRKLVEELGPEVFPDFEKSRIFNHNASDYNRQAANKLGRGVEFESSHIGVDNENSPTVNTLFEKEMERFDI